MWDGLTRSWAETVIYIVCPCLHAPSCWHHISVISVRRVAVYRFFLIITVLGEAGSSSYHLSFQILHADLHWAFCCFLLCKCLLSPVNSWFFRAAFTCYLIRIFQLFSGLPVNSPHQWDYSRSLALLEILFPLSAYASVTRSLKRTQSAVDPLHDNVKEAQFSSEVCIIPPPLSDIIHREMGLHQPSDHTPSTV